MIVDRKSAVAFVSMTRKRNTCINESIFKKLAFYEDFTAKVYEEHSRNFPGYTFRQWSKIQVDLLCFEGFS